MYITINICVHLLKDNTNSIQVAVAVPRTDSSPLAGTYLDTYICTVLYIICGYVIVHSPLLLYSLYKYIHICSKISYRLVDATYRAVPAPADPEQTRSTIAS